jgi:hypothetical protein
VAKRGFLSRQIARGVKASSHLTPDTENAIIYEQRWTKDYVRRVFRVLAPDDKSARVMGTIRIQEKYKSDPIDWVLEHVRQIERTHAGVLAVLAEESKTEQDYRMDRFRDNQ